MTVSTEVSREEYTGNGVTTDFDYRFRVFEAADLVVSVADTTETITVLTLNTDYTVTGAGSRTGGKVKLLSPLAFNWRINIERALPVTQETDIRNQGNFFPEVHEDAFDKLTMLIQQVWGYFGLALRKPTWLAKYYDAQGNRIANLADPINDQDAVNRRSMYSYVEQMIAGVVGGYGWFTQFGSGAIARTFQAKMRESVSVLDFGADPSGINDSTLAFRQAIAAAINANCKDVYVPSGDYLITDELNLGGIGYVGSAGVTLRGENWARSTILFKAASNTSVCISSHGGSGIHTSKALDHISVRAHPDTVAMGIALRLRGTCFFNCSNFVFTGCYVGIHLLNASTAGAFTEFNRFSTGRLYYNLTNILFEVNGGDNSFHGNDFVLIQNQVRPGGVGVKVIGTTSPAYLYNQNWQMNFFGGTSHTAFELTRCNTDNLWGNLTHEGGLVCRTTDASSVFEFKGNFSGIGSVSWDVFTESPIHFGSFVFTNMSSNSTAFTNANLSSYTPGIFNPQLADRMDNGVADMLFTHRSNAGRGLGFNVSSDSPGWFFTVTSGGNMQTAVPRYRFATDGNALTAYATTFYLNPSNSTYGLQLATDTLKTFAPRADNVMSCGAGAFRWTQIYAVNGSISTSSETEKTRPRDITLQEIMAFSLISRLPMVWQWIDKYLAEGDEARIHSGPTVQAAIAIMTEHGLDWTQYSAFCYDTWEATDDVIEDDGTVIPGIPAGDRYGFRRDELLTWCLRALVYEIDTLKSDVSEIKKLIGDKVP